MRKFVLITAIVLATASAQAGERSLTLATGDTNSAVTPAPATDAKVAQASPAVEPPKYIERPAVVETKPPPVAAQPVVAQPAAQPASPSVAQTASAPRVQKPRGKRMWTEARIIHELHRHGIYW